MHFEGAEWKQSEKSWLMQNANTESFSSDDKRLFWWKISAKYECMQYHITSYHIREIGKQSLHDDDDHHPNNKNSDRSDGIPFHEGKLLLLLLYHHRCRRNVKWEPNKKPYIFFACIFFHFSFIITFLLHLSLWAELKAQHVSFSRLKA